MIGRTSVKAEELARCFYYRVYFNMGVLGRVFEDVGLPAESIELMINSLPEGATKPAMRPTWKTWLRLPRMLRFAIEKWNFAGPMSKALPVLREKLKTFDYLSAETLPEEELVSEAERLYDVVQDVMYYNTVGQILMGMFNRGLRMQLARLGVDFKDFDLMEGHPEIESYDPKKYLHELHSEYMNLDPNLRVSVRKATYPELMKMTGLEEFQSRFTAFLERFGHLSDNGNDFSSIPWRDAPEMVIQWIADFVPEKKETGGKIRYSQIKKSLLGRALYERARDFRFLREEVSSLYTFGYGLFRYYYLAMGKILSRRGWITEPGDIFYLTRAEVHQSVLSPEPLFDYHTIIQQHRVGIERFRDLPLPAIIYGDVPPPVQDQSLEKLIGIPTSIGHYTGTVASVRGMQDFAKVKQGDVLVIPYSDVSWTPLFARAGAVVSESGGLLSHSSIVAREYNIPAVVSAEGAMRLQDQTLVTVNGHTGEVIIHTQDN
jgi:pyruvate,water dikinase